MPVLRDQCSPSKLLQSSPRSWADHLNHHLLVGEAALIRKQYCCRALAGMDSLVVSGAVGTHCAWEDNHSHKDNQLDAKGSTGCEDMQLEVVHNRMVDEGMRGEEE